MNPPPRNIDLINQNYPICLAKHYTILGFNWMEGLKIKENLVIYKDPHNDIP